MSFRWYWTFASLVWVIALVQPTAARAETGYDAWLRYPQLSGTSLQQARGLITQIVLDNDADPILKSAADELARGCSGLLGTKIGIAGRATQSGAVVLRTKPAGNGNAEAPDGFSLKSVQVDGHDGIAIVGETARGTLYGAFALLRILQTDQSIQNLNVAETPAFAMRMANQWDNPNGTIERGYGGASLINWATLPAPDPRHHDFAKLLASVGFSGLCINNVNADPRYLSPAYLTKIAAIASEFRPYGIQLFIAVSFDSPRKLGGLKTSDPLDPAVREWWAKKADEVYRIIPDLGGYVIKADSEGQPGPYAYGRDHAQGANALAAALRPHHGLLIWRAFVYKNAGADRLKAAYETFKPLDGKFDDNVILQVKFGPLDFQVREPVNPLFGAMPHTNLMLEVQAAQEYTGHDVHLCYLAPMWNDVLQFDTHRPKVGSTVGKLLSAASARGPRQGIAAVTNLGDSPEWAGNLMAMSNVYAIGRMSWTQSLTPDQIAEEWTRMTFGNNPSVVKTIRSMLMASHSIYESYTSPLGLGMLSDVATHYSPSPQRRSRWNKADHQGVGFDRTAATGSGYVKQYADAVARQYEDPATTPESLLLFFHHLPYGYVMKDGKTLIQTLYDLHREGAQAAQHLTQQWASINGLIDAERYEAVKAKLQEQARQAILWRDAVNGYFQKESGIPDASTH